MNELAKCEICGHEEHVLENHINFHGINIEEYIERFPNAPIYSKTANDILITMQEKHGKNERCDFDILKTFKISKKSGGTIGTISGWIKPHITTPEIDPDYIFERNLLSDILFTLSNKNERLLLTGPTGSGKTSAPVQVCARLNLPVTRFSCDSDVTRSDFIGQWTLDGNNTKFLYGILPTAMREGRVLILDEWDTLNPSVSMLLQPVLEDNGKLILSETNEVIETHPDFRIIATSNTVGMGDESGLYNGTQPQNYAQLNRFTMVEIVNYPAVSVEHKIITAKTGIEDKELLNKFTDVATMIREAFMKGEIMGTMSTRAVVNIAKKFIAFGDIKRTYSLCFTNMLNTDDRAFVGEVLNRIWGIK